MSEGREIAPGIWRDLANAWAYVRAHRDEIDRQIEEQESA
jgi:hypothetical protein